MGQNAAKKMGFRSKSTREALPGGGGGGGDSMLLV